MPDVCQDQPIFCLEEIVVFVVSGDIYIGSLSYCGRSEEGTGTAADGYFPDLRFTDCSVTDDFTTESLFYLLQERQTIGWGSPSSPMIPKPVTGLVLSRLTMFHTGSS